MFKSIIEQIQDEDPSYNPLTQALVKSGVNRDKWNQACNRIYVDGYYGPVSTEEWAETNGFDPISVSEARNLVAKVLDKVENYLSPFGEFYPSEDIKAALVPFYSQIYGERYPSYHG